MERVLLRVLAPLLLAGCVPGSTDPSITTAEEVVERHIAALGGKERLRSLASLTSYGVYEEPSFRQVHRFDAKRPNLIRITTNYDRETGSFGFCEGYDGAAWEYSFSVPRRVRGMPATALRHASDFDGPFIDHELKGHALEFMGRTTFLDRDVYQVRVGESDYFFDAESFMHVMSRAVVPFHGEGRAEEIVAVFSDFRPVAGVPRAHKVVEQARPSGEILSTLIWEEVQGNPEIPDEWFAPPLSAAQKAYDRFRARVLGGEGTSMGAAYGEYRTAARREFDQQRENELNTLGYELLSHERLDDAIAVFALGVAEFPDAPNLHDSLGEAFMAAERYPQAIAAYRRAIALDPSNDHAQRMIDEMSAADRWRGAPRRGATCVPSGCRPCRA